MARPINRLSARAVKAAAAGYHADGAGLYLLVTAAGTGSWVYRFTLRGRKREMGLGSTAVFSLAEARDRAAAQRRLVADGMDPIDTRRTTVASTPRTWGEARDAFIEAKAGEWRNPDQAVQWRQSLRDYGPPDDLPIALLDTDAVLQRLRALWRPGGKVETATRVRGRIERIWDAERVRGHVSGENPARWRGHLEHLLPRAAKVAKPRHHPAMPYPDLPAFMTRLRERDGVSRLALRFTILTAVRTSETTGAEWAELDLERAVWTIPAERMKAAREHVVPLAPEAVAILRARAGQPRPFAIGIAAMLALLQKPAPKGMGQPYTVHGFRSAFKDWASEETDTAREVSEMALAHTIRDETEAAYRRGNLLEKRRLLMLAWAEYLAQPA